MKICNISILLFLMMNHLGFSQKIQYGVAASKGFKAICQEESIGLYGRFWERMDLEFSWCNGKFNGEGFTTGAKFLILKKQFQPYVGVGYTSNVGKKSKGTIYNEYRGVYKIYPNNLYYLDAGLIWNYKLADEPGNIFSGLFLLKLSCTYRVPVNPIKTNFIEGDYSAESEKELQKRVGQGFGACLSVIVLLSTKARS